MEGLFSPQDFSFPKAIDKERVLRSIVKVRPLRTLEYQFFANDDEAAKFSTTVLDGEGFETIRCGMSESDKEAVNNPEFSQALFTHEFCELLKAGDSFPAKTALRGNGNGVLISADGYIVTNYHLISGAVELHKSTDSGYFGKEPVRVKNIEVEILDKIANGELIYRKATEVFLVASYSKTDAYGNKKDLALLKISEAGLNFLPISKEAPKRFAKIYSVGFSMRTARKEERKKMLGYADANYDLRVSTGLVTNLEANSFLADTDGAPGNSGSVGINEQGEIIGIYCGSTGNGIVDPSKSYRRYVNAQHIEKFLT